MALISFVTTILATYRLAHLLPDDNGPFFIFERIRVAVSEKAINENELRGFWASVDDWTTCPYCQGIYIAILVVWLSEKKKKWSNLFLLVFAIAGGQSLLQRWGEK
jgi:hypothetical protein